MFLAWNLLATFHGLQKSHFAGLDLAVCHEQDGGGLAEPALESVVR
jgi:hypothetical protein